MASIVVTSSLTSERRAEIIATLMEKMEKGGKGYKCLGKLLSGRICGLEAQKNRMLKHKLKLPSSGVAICNAIYTTEQKQAMREELELGKQEKADQSRKRAERVDDCDEIFGTGGQGAVRAAWTETTGRTESNLRSSNLNTGQTVHSLSSGSNSLPKRILHQTQLVSVQGNVRQVSTLAL
jgi:hypothetical protein